MLISEYLDVNDIEIGYQAEDYRDAIREAGKILVNKGAADESYVDAMIETCDELEAYIVLVPGVAIPHASPDKGAKKVGLSLVQLKTPVNFNHPENDPVKLVIGLASPDNSSHLKALQLLSNFLMNNEMIEQISLETSREKIFELLQNGVEVNK